MPTKQLPSSPSLDHLKCQAKDLLKDYKAGNAQALQRIREFHPRFHKSSDDSIRAAKLSVSDAQLAIAREYGFDSWAKLKRHIEAPSRPEAELPHHERIEDPVFRRAVDLLDAGDVEALRAYLLDHPGLVHQHATLEGGNYFRNPTLLEFIAENPIRHGKLPPNITQVAKVILDAGAQADTASVESALGLVCSGCVPRQCGVQVPLIELLCDVGADPDAAMLPALGHGEFGAVEALLRRGARVDLPVAAATGRIDDARRLLPAANGEKRHLALALAAQHGHAEIVRLLLDAGEDPNRYNPVGCHSHSLPIHQAAYHGHEDVVRLLVERGARLDMKDILFQSTPLDWAKHARRTHIEEYLRAEGALRG